MAKVPKLLEHRRIILRVLITPAAKESVDGFCERTGITHVVATTHLLEWFSAQPELIQAVIMGNCPSAMNVDVVRLILQRMANGDE
jgi:hypothetical protein